MNTPHVWTHEIVKDWLREAAQTERSFPQVKAQGHKAFWPEVVRDANEAYGYNDEPVRTTPDAEQISRYDFVSLWTRCLTEEEAAIVCAWACCVPSKVTEKKHHCGRTKIHHTLNYAVRLITSNLNAGVNFAIMISPAMCAEICSNKLKDVRTS